jgi:PBSX family phage terminase large subunit
VTTTLEHRYAPRGTAWKIFEDESPEILVAGPAGTGKSRAALEKLNAMALKYPGMRGLIVRKTAASLVTTALVTWHQHVIGELLQAGSVQVYGGLQKPEKYTYYNGSTILIAGMDKSTRIMSSEYDMVYVQEATELTEDDWEALTTRLRNKSVMPFKQLIADCNPSYPTHWLKLRCDRGTTTMYLSTHEENPVFFNKDGSLTGEGLSYMSKLDNLTGLRKARLRYGHWAGAEGTIYDEFDPSCHVIDRIDIRPEWARYWAVDFGYTNPTVIQWWAEDEDGRLYLYREIYQTGTVVTDLAKQALSLVTGEEGQWIEPKPRRIICDHDAENQDQFRQAIGLGTSNANKKVLPGIEAVQKRLRRAGDGKPRLFLLKDSLVKRDQALADKKKPTSTEEEVLGYIWDTGMGKATKESPVKENDHGMDAMRYMVAYRDLKKRIGVSFA